MSSLSDSQKTVLLKEIGISLTPAASNLSALLGKNVSLRPQEIRDIQMSDLKKDKKPYVSIKVQLDGDIEGILVVFFNEKDAAMMSDLMIGGGGTNPPQELDDLHFSAINEILGQMMDSIIASLGTTLSKMITSSSPSIKAVSFETEIDSLAHFFGGSTCVEIVSKFTIEGLLESEVILLMNEGLGNNILEATGTPSIASKLQKPQAISNENLSQTENEISNQDMGSPIVQPVQFPSLTPLSSAGHESNLELLMDVSLKLTVELGRTNKYVREVLALGSGSVVQLDKLAGEQVDVLVNDKLIAKGEVVVINESFGVRITEIVSPKERVEYIR